MTDNQTTEAEYAVKRWRARERCALALVPIFQGENLDVIAAGEIVDAVLKTFERSMGEALPEGWRKYVR